MLAGADPTAFLAATDRERAREFFAGALGLPLVDESSFALVFDLNGIPLRVTFVTELKPADYTVLGWHVADVEAAADELAARGVSTERFAGMEQDERGIW